MQIRANTNGQSLTEQSEPQAALTTCPPPSWLAQRMHHQPSVTCHAQGRCALVKLYALIFSMPLAAPLAVDCEAPGARIGPAACATCVL